MNGANKPQGGANMIKNFAIAIMFLFVFALVGIAPAQECRQPKSATPSVKGEVGEAVVIIGTTAGAEAASRHRWWGSSAGSVAQSVIWAKTSERINNRQAASADYATCKAAETQQRQIESSERMETIRVGADLERVRLEAATRAAEAASRAAESARRSVSTCGSAGGTQVCGYAEPPRAIFSRN